MSILSYIKGLLPRFGKDRLQEDLNLCRNDLQNTVFVAFEQATALSQLNSKQAKAFEKYWFSHVKDAKRTTFVRSVEDKLKKLIPILDVIDKNINENFENEVINIALTANKANVIKIVEVVGFLSLYALKFLNYLYICEMVVVKGDNQYIRDSLAPAEIKIIENGFTEFCIGLNALTKNGVNIAKTLDSIPDILVNARGEVAINGLNSFKVDPLGLFSATGFTGNPIYHVGVVVAQMQANRYKRQKELKTILELRLLDLQNNMHGQDDPGIGREIEVVQSRIDALDERIRKAEESVK